MGIKSEYLGMTNLRLFIATMFTNFSDETRRQYMDAYQRLLVWVDGKRQKETPELTPILALAYLADLKDRGLSDRTIKNYFIKLNRVFSAAVEFGVIKSNPWPKCKSAISWRQLNDRRPTQYIEDSKVIAALAIDKSNSIDGIRDQALLCLLFGSGLRRSELAKLKIGSIKTTPTGTIFLEITQPKGGQTDRSPIPSWAWPSVSELISKRKSEGADESSYLFVTSWSSKHISTETVYRVYKKYVGEAPHSARATFATKLHLQGFSDDEVARALRHKSTQMVRVYRKREIAVDECVGKKVSYG